MAAKMSLGFIGLGIMGTGMVRNLLKAGHEVTVWNRSVAKSEELAKEGAKVASSPADLVSKCPVTIAMLATPAVALEVALGENGVVSAMGPGKSYIDMSTVDAGTSKQICQAVVAKGGRFLEGPVSGSKKPAADGTLIILAAGDEGLFKEVAAPFDAMGKKAFFLGEVGNGARMKLIVNMIMGCMMTSFGEGMAVAEKAGLSQETLVEVLGLGAMGCQLFALKGQSVLSKSYPPAFPLKHQQKDLRLALALGDELDQPMPVAAAANEAYKEAKNLGFAENDFSAVYNAIFQQPH